MILKLWKLLGDLPLPFLILSLSLVSVALPVHSTELTPENFKSSTSTGVWFIEHFSPYCGHCRAFAPTWEELVAKNEEGSPEKTGVKLAQINCAVNGDLCSANGVKGYPQMNLYKDGEFVETFKGARDLDRLTEFLQKHSPSLQFPSAEVIEVIDKSEPEPETLTPGTNPNLSGSVLVLDDTNIANTIKEGPAFIKFYAPWCGHCKKLAPTWKTLAKNMQYKLTIAEVDCEANKAVCKDYDIQGFPTLIYVGDDSKTEYTGGRKLEQLREFAEKASRGGAQPISADELEKHVSEESLVYTLLYPSNERKLVSVLKPLFASLLGSPVVYTIADPPSSLTSRLSVPTAAKWTIVALKDHDFTTPSAVYSTPLSATSLQSDNSKLEDIKIWLARNRLPTTIELTQDTFQSVMNSPARPLVVLAPVTKSTKDKVEERMELIGKKWRSRTEGSGMIHGKTGDRPVVFAWMDMERWKDWMKSMYGIKNKGTSDLDDIDVIIADHKALLYYNSDVSGSPLKLSSTLGIFSALEGVAKEQISPKNSENLIERVARYLSSKLQSVESYVINHPKHIAFYVVVGLVVVVWLIRRALADEPTDRDYMRSSKVKADRLD